MVCDDGIPHAAGTTCPLPAHRRALVLRPQLYVAALQKPPCRVIALVGLDAVCALHVSVSEAVGAHARRPCEVPRTTEVTGTGNRAEHCGVTTGVSPNTSTDARADFTAKNSKQSGARTTGPRERGVASRLEGSPASRPSVRRPGRGRRTDGTCRSRSDLEPLGVRKDPKGAQSQTVGLVDPVRT